MEPPPSPRTILILDDEPAFREVLTVMLERAGYQIVSAKDGRNGVKCLSQQTFDLVITDLLMPDADGLEFISRARQMQPGLRIIAMTGGGQLPGATYLQIARGLGAYSLLEKPFGRAELLEAVAAALAAGPANAPAPAPRPPAE